MEKTEPRKKYYIQPEDLRVEISAYKETGEASERLGEMLLQIASGLAAGSKWDRRTYRDDMVSDAVVRMFKNLHLIDTTDPSDLLSMCQRDLNKNAQIKYAAVIPDEESGDKPDWKDCVIDDVDPDTNTATISLFKTEDKTVPVMTDNEEPVQSIDKNGEPEFTTIQEIVFTKEIENVPLMNLQFKKTNPFSYLTMIAHRVYIGRSFKENKISNAIDQYKEECYSEFETAECISNRSPHDGDMDMGFVMHEEESV